MLEMTTKDNMNANADPSADLSLQQGTDPIGGRIIVMGASAGGVEALLKLAPQLASNLAAPIVLVLHIGAHRSHLPELLNAHGPLRAVFARSGTVPLNGTIHVAPSDQHVLLEGGVLRLTHGPKEHHSRPAIDPLFRSAALDVGARAIGVVLTGYLDDGSAGLQAIKACGGTAVVQDPLDAAEASMPRSAIACGPVDHVVALDALADLLNRLAQTAATPLPAHAPDWLRTEHAITIGKGHMQELTTIGAPSGFTCPDCGGAMFELGQKQPVRFMCHTGHAFSLRSLARAQEKIADHALWSGLRALQEKEGMLRRMAKQHGDDAADTPALMAEADELAAFIDRLRSAVVKVPPSRSKEVPTDEARQVAGK